MNGQKAPLRSVNRPVISKDGLTMTVHVPATFRQQGGRKQIVTPPGAAPWSPATRIDNALVKAVVRAYRWRDMLETGKYATVRELANAEKMNESYFCRVLRLSLLAPKLVELILEGRQPASLEVEDLLKPISIEWDKQMMAWKSR